MVIIAVVLVVHFTSSSTPTDVKPGPVPSQILKELTSVPVSVYNKVGTGSTVVTSPPTTTSKQKPLKITGKPGAFFLGGEFCPFCAAERWAVITSMARFGTFSGLETMASSSTDTDPSTQSFTFVHAKYSSKYLAAWLVEAYSNTADHAPLEKTTKAQDKLLAKYDTSKTDPTASGSIPFFDIGNLVIDQGATYSPDILQGLSRSQIAGELDQPTQDVTKAIIGTSNYFSAGICAVDGDQPASVCKSAGVKAAAAALKVTG